MGNWFDLIQELDFWADEGRVATFWWRDDDAIEPTPQLERLLQIAAGTPVALAVIPNQTSEALASRIESLASVVVLQHGWAHRTHVEGSLNEYPACRVEDEVLHEFMAGRAQLESLFGDHYLPVFVPPFHGFDDRFLPLLVESGLRAVSIMGPRPSPWALNRSLFVCNAHVAPIRWTSPPSFGGQSEYIGKILGHLRGRRTGAYNAAEPTGLLTHHLVQDDASLDFVAQLVEVVACHPGAEWSDCRSLFGGQPARRGANRQRRVREKAELTEA